MSHAKQLPLLLLQASQKRPRLPADSPLRVMCQIRDLGRSQLVTLFLFFVFLSAFATHFSFGNESSTHVNQHLTQLVLLKQPQHPLAQPIEMGSQRAQLHRPRIRLQRILYPR